jgi:hypothetical protein
MELIVGLLRIICKGACRYSFTGLSQKFQIITARNYREKFKFIFKQLVHSPIQSYCQ